jgi:ABC-type dipeptide/oligopeptide/nickel transport system ATPase subunit
MPSLASVSRSTTFVPTAVPRSQVLTQYSVVALMGASGAGKTTLLNTLSQRQKVGVVSGDMLVDGRPLDTEFQRGSKSPISQSTCSSFALLPECVSMFNESLNILFPNVPHLRKYPTAAGTFQTCAAAKFPPVSRCINVYFTFLETSYSYSLASVWSRSLIRHCLSS